MYRADSQDSVLIGKWDVYGVDWDGVNNENDYKIVTDYEFLTDGTFIKIYQERRVRGETAVEGFHADTGVWLDFEAEGEVFIVARGESVMYQREFAADDAILLYIESEDEPSVTLYPSEKQRSRETNLILGMWERSWREDSLVDTIQMLDSFKPLAMIIDFFPDGNVLFTNTVPSFIPGEDANVHHTYGTWVDIDGEWLLIRFPDRVWAYAYDVSNGELVITDIISGGIHTYINTEAEN
jgi:hypothetical protein